MQPSNQNHKTIAIKDPWTRCSEYAAEYSIPPRDAVSHKRMLPHEDILRTLVYRHGSNICIRLGNRHRRYNKLTVQSLYGVADHRFETSKDMTPLLCSLCPPCATVSSRAADGVIIASVVVLGESAVHYRKWECIGHMKLETQCAECSGTPYS